MNLESIGHRMYVELRQQAHRLKYILWHAPSKRLQILGREVGKSLER